MRVIHVITRLIVGGAQENTITSVLGLQRKPGLQVDLTSGPSTGPEGSLVSAFESPVARESTTSAAPNRKLTIIPELVRPIHPVKDWRALRKLENLFRETKPDIVHTHSGKAGILGRLAAKRAGVPIIIHTIHGPSFGNFQGPLPNWLFRVAEGRAGRATTHFISVANAMTEQYLAAGIGRWEQYTTIFSGFDLAPFLAAKNDLQLRSQLGLAAEDIVIGKIARLFKLKGHDDLFTVAPEIIRANRRIKFLFVGDGKWRERFAQRARTLDLEKHFIFAGLIAPENVANYVGIMDALVHLFVREGLPRALPQALAAGKPVIAYDCDGAKEVCFENETGFLLRPGDLVGLTERVLRLANDSALRHRLGLRGREFVQERFSAERMVDDLHKLYLKLAAQAGLRTA